MTSTADIKAECLAWLRFVRRCPVVCTEAGPWNSDVLGLTARRCIEVEVKVSMSDLRNEFRSKAPKHHVYRSEDSHRSKPNLFYFAVPEDLAVKAREYIVGGGHMPKAGLLSMTGGHLLAGRNLEVVVPAQPLHDEAPALAMVLRAMRRMGSELVQLRLDQVGLERRFQEFMSRLEHDHQVETVRLDGGLDIEAPDAHAETRGRDLAKAVQPTIDWDALDPAGRQLWIQAATRLWDQQNLDLEAWGRALRSC